MISRVHSFLLNLHGHWEVRDNRSVNGIFVNDRKVQEAVLKDGDVVVFGGGGDHPIGAIIEQPDSEFRYEFRINTHWNSKPSKETPLIEEDDSEEDTLDGGSDSRNPNDNLLFEMDPTVPTPPSCVTLDTSPSATAAASAATSSATSHAMRSSKSVPNPSSSNSSSSEQQRDDSSMALDATEPQQSNSKKSKSHRIPDSEATPHASKSSHSSSGATSKSSSAQTRNEWPSGPESKKVFLGPTPTPDLPNRPILSATTLLSDFDDGTRSSAAEGSAGTSDELRQSESSSVAANQADAASSTSAGQEHEIDDESKARIAHLQTELHQACEERRRLPPIYRAPDDSDLSCKLCRNLIFNPTTMGCGHTFCDSCVEFLVIENPKCPECGASVAPPILSSQTLKQEVIAVVRDWSRTDQTAWVAYMTRRNEAIRYAGLELLLESFRARGVRFVNIEERWSDSDRYAFAEGIDVYSLNSRMAFCRAVGLTASWVQNATFDLLLLALGNLGLNLTVPIIRARARAASLPYDSLQDEPEEETRYWSDSSSSSSSSSSSDAQKASLLGIDDEIAFQREGALRLDAEAEDAEERTRRLASRRGIIVDEAERLEREALSLDDEEEALEEGSKRRKSKRAPRRLSIVEPDLAVPPALLPTANLGELDTPIMSARRPEKIPEEDEEGTDSQNAPTSTSTKFKGESAMDLDEDGEVQPTAVDESGNLASSTATPAVITFHDLIVEAMREEIMQYIIQNRRQFMHYQASQRMRLYYDQHPDPRHQPPHPPPHAYAQPIPGVAPLPGDAQRAAAAGQREAPEEGVPAAPQRTSSRRYFHLGARLGQNAGGEANPLQPLHQLLTDLQGAQRVLPPAAPTTPIPPIIIRPRPAALQAHFGNDAAAHHHHHHHHRHQGGGHHQHGPGIRNPHLVVHDPVNNLLQPDQAPPARPDLGHAQVLMRQPPADPAAVPAPQVAAPPPPQPNNDNQNEPEPDAE